MTKKEFQKLITEKPIFLDGATGSNLQKMGMPTGVCPEQWILESKEVLISLQQQFVEAGCNILYAPTFGANRIKLEEYGLVEHIETMNMQLVQLSKEAANGKALVAGDITMTGEQLSPIGTLDFEELITIYKEQITLLEKAGVDLLVIETMMSLQETRAAVIAAKEVSTLPIMATLTFTENGTTLYGTTPETAVVVLQELGVDAVGLNCSTGPDKMVPLIKKMKEYATIPLIAKPNAGLPTLGEDGTTQYDMGVEEYVSHMLELLKAGANILGGCCGTTPEYMKAVVSRLKNETTLPPLEHKIRCVTSETRVLPLPLDGSTKIIGEKINPSGKKALQAELKQGVFDIVIDFAKEQEDAGAALLDVNMGMGGIDEKESMLLAMEEIMAVSSLPLCIDTSNPEVMEAALRRYPGRALVNSVSNEKVKIEKFLPLVKKYGAMFILLPLSDEGLPKNNEEKCRYLHKILEEAENIGLTKEDITVDALVSCVGVNANAGREIIETIRYATETLKVATVAGLGNISFGLPNRSVINGALISASIQSGMNMCIANPCDKVLMGNVYAADMLHNRTNGNMKYLEEMKGETKKESLKTQESEAEVADILYQAVLKGNKNHIVELVEEKLKEGITASSILNDSLLPAITKVGALYDKQVYFLPQLILSAETMKKAIARITPLLKNSGSPQKKDKIIMATVEGDIHDIGKDLVVMMLENFGYPVIDLGKNVPKEVIIETAIREKVSIIGLSALMTTTMRQMEEVIKIVKERNLPFKVIVGGAVITQSYADEIGADGYSTDAAQAVKLVDALTI